MVLLGHLDGPYSTFLRLHELKPGDEFTVITEEAQHQYRVRSVYETTPDDVAVLAPTDAATATLITCSGKWIPAQSTYDHRLIVTADYIGR
jgi:sortase A